MKVVMKMCTYIREKSPETKILLGSYGAQAFAAQYDEETKKKYVDHVVLLAAVLGLEYGYVVNAILRILFLKISHLIHMEINSKILSWHTKVLTCKHLD